MFLRLTFLDAGEAIYMLQTAIKCLSLYLSSVLVGGKMHSITDEQSLSPFQVEKISWLLIPI